MYRQGTQKLNKNCVLTAKYYVDKLVNYLLQQVNLCCTFFNQCLCVVTKKLVKTDTIYLISNVYYWP